MTQAFDAHYFYRKFSAIPRSKWLVGDYGMGDENAPHCALGHCGLRFNNDSCANSDEALSLRKIFMPFGVPNINDAEVSGDPFVAFCSGLASTLGRHPQDRILNFIQLKCEWEASSEYALEKIPL